MEKEQSNQPNRTCVVFSVNIAWSVGIIYQRQSNDIWISGLFTHFPISSRPQVLSISRLVFRVGVFFCANRIPPTSRLLQISSFVWKIEEIHLKTHQYTPSIGFDDSPSLTDSFFSRMMMKDSGLAPTATRFWWGGSHLTTSVNVARKVSACLSGARNRRKWSLDGMADSRRRWVYWKEQQDWFTMRNIELDPVQ